MWHVSDHGRIEVKLRAEGEQALRSARTEADRFFANIVSDLSATLGIDAILDELRYSISKTRPEVNITWRAQVPEARVAEVREYFMRLAQSMDPVPGEVIEGGTPDQ